MVISSSIFFEFVITISFCSELFFISGIFIIFSFCPSIMILGIIIFSRGFSITSKDFDFLIILFLFKFISSFTFSSSVSSIFSMSFIINKISGLSSVKIFVSDTSFLFISSVSVSIKIFTFLCLFFSKLLITFLIIIFLEIRLFSLFFSLLSIFIVLSQLIDFIILIFFSGISFLKILVFLLLKIKSFFSISPLIFKIYFSGNLLSGKSFS